MGGPARLDHGHGAERLRAALFVFTETGSFAGAVVDRVDRRVAMLVADATAGVATLALFGLFSAGTLLFGLLRVYSGVNFMLSFGNVLLIPLVVAFASEAAAGGVLSAAGVGGVAGSLVVSAWPGRGDWCAG